MVKLNSILIAIMCVYSDTDDVILDERKSPDTKFDEIALNKEMDQKEKPDAETEQVTCSLLLTLFQITSSIK